MSAVLHPNVAARLVLAGDVDETPVRPTSWFITHGFGKPAEGTFTEVAFADDVLELLPALHTDDQIERVLDDAVRIVAGQLYGNAWAFHYRPEQYDEAIDRFGLRRRELVLVSALEVWT